MTNVSKENLPFILEKILLHRDTDREVTESKKFYISKEKKIIFYFKERREEGEEVDLTQLRKNYTGTMFIEQHTGGTNDGFFIEIQVKQSL